MNYKYIIAILLLNISVNCFTQIIDTVSVGESGKNYWVAGFPSSTYEWQVEGCEINYGNNTNAINVTWGNVGGIYTLKVVEYTDAGCYGDTIKAQVYVNDIIEVPEVISPNNDGKNDKFYVKSLYTEQFNIEIFNRFGTLIFQSTDLNFTWEGKYHNNDCMEDVYYYIIQYANAQGLQTKKGYFYLKR